MRKLIVVVLAIVFFFLLGWAVTEYTTVERYMPGMHDGLAMREAENLFSNPIETLLIRKMITFRMEDNEPTLIRAYTFYRIPFADAKIKCVSYSDCQSEVKWRLWFNK